MVGTEFDEHARQVVRLANQEAIRFCRSEIDSEHILMALVKEGTGITEGATDDLGADLRTIRLSIEKRIEMGDTEGAAEQLPYTSLGQKVIDLTKQEAVATAESKSSEVRAEHVFRALLRAGEGIAYEVLTDLGYKYEPR